MGTISSPLLIHLTQVRQLLLACAAIWHRERTLAWPAAPSALDLPPELLIDACSDQPLVLRTDGETIVIYAWGFDGDDDGGRALELKDVRAGDGDIVLKLTVPRSPPAEND